LLLLLLLLLLRLLLLLLLVIDGWKQPHTFQTCAVWALVSAVSLENMQVCTVELKL
jgi:hypothetical protein